MSQELASKTDNPANQYHLCAKQVAHEQWGKGDCIPTMHGEPTEDGLVEWYDVMFEHGIETRVATEDLEILFAEGHMHASADKKKKGKQEINAVKEEEGEMPSKAEVMALCKDGKSADEICAMYPDCDQEKLKAMIDGCQGDLNEDNTNDDSDDGEGLDKVQPKAVKKKFDDRKDKDIDNDGDEDESDKYLHMRRKAISKALSK
jgi:hypothetical protein